MIAAVIERCAGIDVGKKVLAVCIMTGAADAEPEIQQREYSTFNRELGRLRDWLIETGCTHVVMESTGSYWRPVFEILEGNVTVILANPEQVKSRRGHKTDWNDACWLAHLLRHDMVRASFIPPRSIRELRDLTRRRKQVLRDATSERNRIQKVLETANVKVRSVLADVFGVSGQQILEALLEGNASPEQMAQMVHGRAKAKVPALVESLAGHRMSEHHRWLIRQSLEHLAFLEQHLIALDERILQQIESSGYQPIMKLLESVPGIQTDTAACILAEMGADIQQFPSPEWLSSWAGVCPGNYRSAGVARSGHIRGGNRWLRNVLVESAWAVAARKQGVLREKFWRWAGHGGRKKALIALAHSLLVIIHHVLLTQQPYAGEDAPLSEARRKHLIRQHIRKLGTLGVAVRARSSARYSAV
jgi:transposase